MHAGTSTRFQVGNGTFIDRRLLSMSGRRPRPLAGGHERRLGGNRQRDGAAVEHDDDGRHAGPKVLKAIGCYRLSGEGGELGSLKILTYGSN